MLIPSDPNSSDSNSSSSNSSPDFTFKITEGTSRLPRGISRSRLSRISFAAENLYKEYGRLPSVGEIALRAGCTEKSVTQVLVTQEFLDRMAKRGIIWSAKNRIIAQLTPEQIALMAVLTDPTLKLDLRARLKRAGVPYSVYRNWLKNPAFSRVIRNTAESSLDDHLPDFHTKIVEKGLAGDLNAIKFAYELTGRHDPAKQQMVDFSRLVMLVLEVITKYVTDPVALKNINVDIDSILRGEVPKAVEVLPANYVASEVVNKDMPDFLKDMIPEDFFELKDGD